MTERYVKTFLSAVLLWLVVITSQAQTTVVTNGAGKYSVTAPASWRVQKDGSTTDLYAPDESAEDAWLERLGISMGPANGLSLEEAFDYYRTQDFPGYYQDFRVLKKGAETINGKKALWMVYSYSASGKANGDAKAARVNDLFYLILDNDTLYFLDGVTEESHFAQYEAAFISIIKTFKIQP